jgi:hypothetical protein
MNSTIRPIVQGQTNRQGFANSRLTTKLTDETRDTRTHLTRQGAYPGRRRNACRGPKERMGFQSKKQPASGTHCCPICGSILVQPVDQHEHGECHWVVDLRCPDCEWWGRDICSQDEIDRYALELDRGEQELVGDLRALTWANMREEADRFAAALATDCILPEDFCVEGA